MALQVSIPMQRRLPSPGLGVDIAQESVDHRGQLGPCIGRGKFDLKGHATGALYLRRLANNVQRRVDVG